MSSSRPAPHAALAGERGGIIVLWALMLTGLVTMLAIVVDLGHLREARATSQSVTDMAALAAGEHLASLSSPDPQQACEDAVRYIRMNVPDLPAGMTVPCGEIPPTCNGSTQKVVVTDDGTAGRYRVEISFPVPDADIADTRTASGSRVDDGHQCERMMVRLQRTNDGFFTGVLGVNQLSTDASAVVRRRPPEVSRIPNLWLLDPTGCPALSTQGSSVLRVGTLDMAGLITVDSDGSADPGSCGGSSYTIDAGGNSRIRVLPVDSSLLNNPNQLEPHGEISLVAMWPGQTTCAEGNPKACRASQVGSTSNIWPQPIRREQRATRAIVDHRYNCRYGQASPQYPNYPEGIGGVARIPIHDCTDSGRGAFVDQLRMGVGPSGQPSGFQRWTQTPDGLPRYSCDNPQVPGELPGNWWIDCETLVLEAGELNFTGGNLVFDGSLVMSGGRLRINSGATLLPDTLDRQLPSQCFANITGCLTQSSPNAALVYFRNGNIRFSSDPVLEVTRSAVIQDGGYLRMNGQAPPRWSAPTEGPFAGLSLWSEHADTTGNYIINGGSGMQLEGVFFTPHAVFTINGGGGLTPQKAQFISYRLRVAGGGTLALEPDGMNQLSLPPPVAALIR